MDTNCIQLSFLSLIWNILFFEVLPFIVHLLINQSISLLEGLSDLRILTKFVVNLHLNELFDQFCLSFQNFDLDCVTVCEVVCR